MCRMWVATLMHRNALHVCGVHHAARAWHLGPRSVWHRWGRVSYSIGLRGKTAACVCSYHRVLRSAHAVQGRQFRQAPMRSRQAPMRRRGRNAGRLPFGAGLPMQAGPHARQGLPTKQAPTWCRAATMQVGCHGLDCTTAASAPALQAPAPAPASKPLQCIPPRSMALIFCDTSETSHQYCWY